MSNSQQPPRFAPARTFPPYSYVTGRHPHPTRDPAGHSFGRQEKVDFDPRHWAASQTYLVAIDLFNYGYYWEAHEEWEALWHACGRRGPTADLLKGLIKLAAAGVKLRENRPLGVHRHAERAIELFSSVARELSPAAEHLGLELGQLSKVAEELAQTPPGTVQEVGVQPLLGVTLRPMLPGS